MPKILLIGNDSYQISEIIQSIKSNHTIKEFSNKDDILQLRPLINQPSMFSQQLFILNNLLEYLTNQDIQQMTNSRDDIVLIEKEARDKLTLTDIINHSVWQIKYLKLLEGNSLFNWIKNEANKINLLISSEVIQKLIELHHNNLFMIENELVRLKHLYYLNKLPIEIPLNIDLGKQTIEGNIFDFTNSVGFRNKQDIIQSYNKLTVGDHWEIYYQLLGCIRNLLRVSVKDLEGIHPYVVSKLTKQIKGWSINELIESLNELIEIENKVKTSKGEIKPLILEWLMSRVSKDDSSGDEPYFSK